MERYPNLTIYGETLTFRTVEERDAQALKWDGWVEGTGWTEYQNGKRLTEAGEAALNPGH